MKPPLYPIPPYAHPTGKPKTVDWMIYDSRGEYITGGMDMDDCQEICQIVNRDYEKAGEIGQKSGTGVVNVPFDPCYPKLFEED